MTAKEIAEKYVHGLHDNLTDADEKREMEKDINAICKKITIIAIIASVLALVGGYWMALQDCGCIF
jgi:Mg2+ and Co2+ transporter CorA